MLIIIFGVSGSGKTSIGKLLAKRLNLSFYDADDFHPKVNIVKMSKGIPLNDEDRKPWLKILATQLKDWERKGGAVLACSALKEAYRKILASQISNQILWVYLNGSYSLIKARIEARENHFMSSVLLKSQFKTLEVPSYGLHVDISQSVEDAVKTIISKL